MKNSNASRKALRKIEQVNRQKTKAANAAQKRKSQIQSKHSERHLDENQKWQITKNIDNYTNYQIKAAQQLSEWAQNNPHALSRTLTRTRPYTR